MVELIALNNEVAGPVGMVYSTAPKTAIGIDGRTYYVKGRNDATAFSEVCGCRLAAAVGLPSPEAHIGTFAGDVYAAVAEVPHNIRNIAPWLYHHNGIANMEDLFGAIVVDCWLVNDDRNMGNLVGVAVNRQQIAVTMIDFEKSKSLGANPTIESMSLDARRLWPTGDLGKNLRPRCPAQPPRRYIDSVGSIKRNVISDIVREVAKWVPVVTWTEASVEVLLGRAQNIQFLMAEIWKRT